MQGSKDEADRELCKTLIIVVFDWPVLFYDQQIKGTACFV
jgi:hypothetical protein